MTLKDLLDVFGNIDVAVDRANYETKKDDWTFEDVYCGSFTKMPDNLYLLNVVSAEPNPNGLNIEVE